MTGRYLAIPVSEMPRRPQGGDGHAAILDGAGSRESYQRETCTVCGGGVWAKLAYAQGREIVCWLCEGSTAAEEGEA